MMDIILQDGKLRGWVIGTAIFVALIILAIVALIILHLKIKNAGSDEVKKNKLAQTQVIFYGGFGIIFLLLISGILVQAFNPNAEFLLNLSATIVVAWMVMLICYYVWAIYFYNVNLGWSDDKWNRLRQEGSASTGIVPNQNPHGEETLGLPPGTVRGTIALTILVGGLALTIGSFGMKTSVHTNEILVDNFDFYKQAFLMMIAFYFGVKSLDILNSSEKKEKVPPTDAGPTETATPSDKEVQKDLDSQGGEG